MDAAGIHAVLYKPATSVSESGWKFDSSSSLSFVETQKSVL